MGQRLEKTTWEKQIKATMRQKTNKQTNKKQPTMRHQDTKITTVKNSDNTKCWRGCRKAGTLTYGW